MNVWFSRLLFLALAVGLIAIIFSLIPLSDQPRDPPEGAIISPDTSPAKVQPARRRRRNKGASRRFFIKRNQLHATRARLPSGSLLRRPEHRPCGTYRNQLLADDIGLWEEV